MCVCACVYSAGFKGRKSGKGFYLYPPTSEKGNLLNTVVNKLTGQGGKVCVHVCFCVFVTALLWLSHPEWRLVFAGDQPGRAVHYSEARARAAHDVD